MVIYEITATVSDNLIPTYEKYMSEIHITDVLATGKFKAAYFTRSTANRYRIQYYALSKESLKEYLQDYAPNLRADFDRHFPAGIEVVRENWDVLKEFIVETA